jgi:hypothetical protein
MFHGHLDCFQKSFLGIRPNTKPKDHDVPKSHNRWINIIYHVWPLWIEIHWNSIWLKARYIWLHTTLEGPWPHYMIMEVSLEGPLHTSFGLSQFHGHGSWLVCEVALRFELTGSRLQKIPSSFVYLLGPFWGDPKRRACLCLYPAHGNLQ